MVARAVRAPFDWLVQFGRNNEIRVGPDVAGEWEDDLDANLYWTMRTAGTRNAMRTVIH